jgi:hypothetical protein
MWWWEGSERNRPRRIRNEWTIAGKLLMTNPAEKRNITRVHEIFLGIRGIYWTDIYLSNCRSPPLPNFHFPTIFCWTRLTLNTNYRNFWECHWQLVCLKNANLFIVWSTHFNHCITQLRKTPQKLGKSCAGPKSLWGSN